MRVVSLLCGDQATGLSFNNSNHKKSFTYMIRYYVMVLTTWKSMNSVDMAAANSLSYALEIQETSQP